MIIVEVCVGSSCHIKGAPRIVEMMQERIRNNHLEDDIVLVGAFCSGRCNRVGVTVTVDGSVYVGVTPEGLGEFWENTIMPALKKSKENDSCPNA